MVIGVAVASGRADAQSNLPQCPTDQKAQWDNCFATFKFDNGRKYVGEWKDGKFTGEGTLTFPDEGEYIGSFKDNLFHGQGTYSHPDGNKYVGEWKDDKPNGQGTMTLADGDKYVGEWKDFQKHGHGTFTYENGDEYVGEFEQGKQHGSGSYSYVNGDKYVGEHKADKRNGHGTYTYADGDYYIGEWKDSNWNGSGKIFSADGELRLAGYWIAGDYFGPTSPGGSRISMVLEHGTYTVPVVINGVLPLHFTVDSGATDVSIPSDVVSVLVRSGSLDESDFIGTQRYTLADGSVITSRVFIIRSLSVGDRTVTNVRGFVADPNGSLLLGQSFLEKFQSWSMDNTKHELVLE